MMHLIFKAVLAYVAYKVIVLLVDYIRWLTSPLWNAPGPKRRSYLLGVYLEIMKEPFMTPHLRWWKSLGEDVRMIAYSTLFGSFSLLLLDADLIKEVLTAQSSKSPSRFPKQYFIKHILGDGLVTLNNEDWSRHRRIIQPSFMVGLVKDQLNQVVPKLISEYIRIWKAAQGRDMDVTTHFSAVTLDILGLVGFSHDFAALQDVKAWAAQATDGDGKNKTTEVSHLSDPLIDALTASLKTNPLRVAFFTLGLPQLEKLLNPTSRRLQREMNAAVDEVIQKARLRTKGGKAARSLLELLLEAKDSEPGGRNLDVEELRNEIKTFLVAGHETTATWCYWAVYAMAKYPDVQEKVYQDIQKHGSESMTLEDVDKMEYFCCFLQEVLRLHPPVGVFFRVNRKAETLGGQVVPKGTRVMTSVHLLHRHPKYWDNPLTFRPERWMGDSTGGRKHAFAFLPFSSGGRNCIGQRFATVEAKLIMAHFIRAFQVEFTEDQREAEFKLTTFVTTKTKPALKVCLKERKH